MGFKEAAIDIDHDATFTQALEGDLALASGLIYDNCSVEGCTGEYMLDEDDMSAMYSTRELVTYSPYVFVMDPELTDPYNLESPDFTPLEHSRRRSPATSDRCIRRMNGLLRHDRLHRRRRTRQRRQRVRHLVAGMDRLLDQLAGSRPALLHGGPAWRGASLLLLRVCALVCLAATAGCGGNAEGERPLPPLHDTFPSPEALSRAVLAALAAGDVETLRALPLDELEFRTAVWPDLPSSRPERNVPFDYAWADLHQKSNNARRRLVARHGGRRYELVNVLFAGETTEYRTYEVHRETVLDLLDEEGHAVRLALFGSILEREGEFKMFSYVVD